ncbi:MAG: sulfite exporter TauE/SafE family protein [Bradyrhizobium sp.]|nr:sulfite exporter TauE/SafE family protein [Bradyrhizobium sp.]
MALGVLAALLVGFAKTGVVGMGILIVPLMATAFPGKASIGALLPMLIFADLFAVARYRRHAQWRLLLMLLPWVLPGLAAGYVTLRFIPAESLPPFLGGMVLFLITLHWLKSRYGGRFEQRLPRSWWFAAVMGCLAGFATMVGNVAGPVMSIYLISMGLKKREFMGTGAWYYLIVNWIKVPFNVSLGLITARSLAFNVRMAPAIAIGALLGILIFKRIPQAWFFRVILLLAAAAATRLLLAG